ncbi:MAG TPA: SHOCT domain-containing protein [Acidimicrobiales bacterium]|nr:SHOCT domain-containing protein [Acidimicrobiales bacterium]
MLAYSYPLLGAFLTILWLSLFFIWIWLFIIVLVDVFRSHDIGGFAKALWVLFIIFLPLLGVLVYLIARGGSMHERSVQRAEQQQQAFRGYVQSAAAPTTTADQLAKLADLKERGVITDAEFQSEKAKLLAS